MYLCIHIYIKIIKYSFNNNLKQKFLSNRTNPIHWRAAVHETTFIPAISTISIQWNPIEQYLASSTRLFNSFDNREYREIRRFCRRGKREIKGQENSIHRLMKLQLDRSCQETSLPDEEEINVSRMASWICIHSDDWEGIVLNAETFQTSLPLPGNLDCNLAPQLYPDYRKSRVRSAGGEGLRCVNRGNCFKLKL